MWRPALGAEGKYRVYGMIGIAGMLQDLSRVYNYATVKALPDGRFMVDVGVSAGTFIAVSVEEAVSLAWTVLCT